MGGWRSSRNVPALGGRMAWGWRGSEQPGWGTRLAPLARAVTQGFFPFLALSSTASLGESRQRQRAGRQEEELQDRSAGKAVRQLRAGVTPVRCWVPPLQLPHQNG